MKNEPFDGRTSFVKKLKASHRVNRQMLQETCLGSYDFGVAENTIFRIRLRLPR